jgi:hypothetical protein
VRRQRSDEQTKKKKDKPRVANEIGAERNHRQRESN